MHPKNRGFQMCGEPSEVFILWDNGVVTYFCRAHHDFFKSYTSDFGMMLGALGMYMYLSKHDAIELSTVSEVMNS